MAWGLMAFAVFSVAWWYATELAGAGDLRFYLLLQAAPLVMVPLWQWLYDDWQVDARRDRSAFGLALLLYVAAKVAELYDHAIAEALGALTGHTLKHLLAAAAAALIVHRLAARVEYRRTPAADSSGHAAR